MRRQNSLVSVVGLGIVLMTSSPAWGQGAELPPNLSESAPLACDSLNHLVISQRLIRTAGNGVEVTGNCTVEIVDSHILADGIAVLVNQNGSVVISNSIIEGGTAALEATGNGSIAFAGSTILGGTRMLQNAKFEDRGGNSLAGQAARGRDEAIRVGEGEIQVGPDGVRVGGVTVGKDGVRVGGAGGVTVGEDGVRVGGAGGVTVGEGSVEVGGAGGVTVRTGPGGDTVVDIGGSTITVESAADGSVRIKTPGVVVSSDWRNVANARYDARDTARILVELGAMEEDGETRLQLAGDVLFDFDSAALRSDAAATLAKVAHVLRQRSGGEVYVVGHTDSVGEESYNQKLSERRAVSVMQWLNANENIPSRLMLGRGVGSKEPLDYNTMPDGSDNEQGRAANRRVEIRFAAGS